MKAILTTILLTCIIGSAIGSPIPVRSEKHPIQINSKSKAFDFGVIHLHRQADGVGLAWTVTDNSVVDGFYIQRSYDGTNFVIVGTLANDANNSWFRYLDAEVFPGFVNYRIVAVLNDGTEVTSSVQSIRILRKK